MPGTPKHRMINGARPITSRDSLTIGPELDPSDEDDESCEEDENPKLRGKYPRLTVPSGAVPPTLAPSVEEAYRRKVRDLQCLEFKSICHYPSDC